MTKLIKSASIIKKSPKHEREKKILIGLVAYYLKSAKPVGSHTLQEAGFHDLSSATIRNYFASLEEEGYLVQQHTSGGRVPTDKAYRLFAQHELEELAKQEKKHEVQTELRDTLADLEGVKEVVLYLMQMAEHVSHSTETASFISSPRFDHDFVTDMRLISFSNGRYLAALETNFGQIHTELLHADKKFPEASLRRMESYFRARLGAGQLSFEELSSQELEHAHRFYQEAMTRYLVSYANFSEEDLFRAGFSKLLRYPELQEAQALASSLSLFENQSALRHLVRDAMKSGTLRYWIGADLFPYLTTELNTAVLVAPYSIGTRIVGAIGLIGPMRIPYRELFSLLEEVSATISKSLTRSLFKHKITFRAPQAYENSTGELKEAGKKRLLLAPKENL